MDGIECSLGKYGIHGTNKPNSIGWASSSGCIRMRNKDVEELYKFVKIGTPVVIWGVYWTFGNGFRTITPGDTGADVYEVQRIMKEKGYTTVGRWDLRRRNEEQRIKISERSWIEK